MLPTTPSSSQPTIDSHSTPTPERERDEDKVTEIAGKILPSTGSANTTYLNNTSLDVRLKDQKTLRGEEAVAGETGPIPTEEIRTVKMAANAEKDPYDKAKGLYEAAILEKKAGLTEDALETFSEAKRVAISINPALDKVWTLASIGEAQGKVKFFEDANKTFSVAKAHARNINDNRDTWAMIEGLLIVAVKQAKAGLIEKAKQSFLDVRMAIKNRQWSTSSDHSLLMDIFWNLGEKEAEVGFIEDATRSFSDAKDAMNKIDTDRGLLRCLPERLERARKKALTD